MEPQETRAASGNRRGFRVGKIAGIELRLDASLIVIFALVVGSLATGLLWQWHPDWQTGVRWLFAALVGVMFFVSILVHELAHALVARLYGIPVPRITLFLFGGVSEMESEPLEPGAELAIAIAGPLTSFAIGALCTIGGTLAAGPEVGAMLQTDPARAFQGLGPLATMLLWLGPVNVLLGAFNLIPGFPLDGGRVLRAAIWKATGSRVQATRWASFGGQFVGWALIAIGIVQVLSGALGGLWLALIGWFLDRAARSSRADVVVREALRDVRVSDLMRTRFEDVSADTPLVPFVEQRALRGAQTVWPVIDGERLVGIVSLEDVARVPEADRARMRVRDVMRPLDPVLSPLQPGKDVLRAVATTEREALPVLDGGRLVGLLHRGDIVRWLALHEDGATA